MNREAILKRLKTSPTRRSILVPEFAEGDEPVRLYFTPITPHDESRVAGMLDGLEIEPHERNIYVGLALMIQKLEFEGGEKVFQAGDIHMMETNLPSSLVGRLVNEISLGEGHYPEAVEAAKNDSGTTGKP